MKTRIVSWVLAGIGIIMLMLSGTAWALDEAVLTPTDNNARPADEQEFNRVMKVWFSHHYSDGERQLRGFVAKHPDSRWAAEANLHIGCFLTASGRYSEAKPIFESVLKKHPDSNVAAKAKIRLANIAERNGKIDDAIKYYSDVLKSNPAWDQFKYANFAARRLAMTKRGRQARINCGPVALSACLSALGKPKEAAAARSISVSEDGISLSELASRSAMLGVKARPVHLSIADMQRIKLPVLAHLNTNHFAAVLSISGDKAQVEDSINGRRTIELVELKKSLSGYGLVFDAKTRLTQLSAARALSVLGGCCGYADEACCSGSTAGCDCEQQQSGSALDSSQTGNTGCATCGSAGGGVGPPSASYGSPTWQVNTVTLNLTATDTPVWYNPGKGPAVAFTLTYANESSNTGIFGRGWRSPYDEKVKFGPNSSGTVDIQVLLGSGRVETYQWDGVSHHYLAWLPFASYGYRDTTGILNATDAVNENLPNGSSDAGTVMITKRSGAKLFYKKQDPLNPNIEGRIYIIQDEFGNRVTCEYDQYGLARVIDANSAVTTVTTNHLSGVDERVIRVDLPSSDSRYATFDYQNGDLIGITDMRGDTSHLYYGVLPQGGTPYNSATTTLAQDVTAIPLSPNNTPLLVASTDGFPSRGRIRVNGLEEMTYNGVGTNSLLNIHRSTTPLDASNGQSVAVIQPVTTLAADISATTPDGGLTQGGSSSLSVTSTDGFPTSGFIQINGSEIIEYTGTTSSAFTIVPRTHSPSAASSGATVAYVTEFPYLWKIETPSKHTMFSYEWWHNSGLLTNQVGLHEVFECGASEPYPTLPTIHYAWCSIPGSLTIVRYPTAVVDGVDGCFSDSSHWTGGLTTTYTADANSTDSTSSITDALGHKVLYLLNDNTRDRISVAVLKQLPSSYESTTYTYSDHDMTSRTDPLGNTWTMTYYDDSVSGWLNHKLLTESDPYTPNLRKYWYNGRGQIAKIEAKVDGKNYSAVTTNGYDSSYRLAWTKDGRGVTTTLGASILSTDTTIPVANAAGFPTSGTVLLESIDSNGTWLYHEVITYTGVNGNLLTGVTRGMYSTTPRAYSAGASAYQGYFTTYYYDGDSRGFLTSVHDPDNKITSYTYDTRGRQSSVTDPNYHTTTYAYDNLDRVTTVTNPDSTTIETAYTCCHKAYVQDENYRRTYYVYDAKLRPFKEIASAASTSLNQSISPNSPADTENLLVTSAASLPDTNGLIVVGDEIISYASKSGNTLQNITRGAQGTMKVTAAITSPVGRVDTVLVTYGYDANYWHRKTSLTDANGHTTYYTYYDNDQLQSIRYPDNPTNKGEWYTYDTVGNLHTKQYGSFTGSYSAPTFVPSKAVTYTYDNNNRLTKQEGS